jgi:isopenicillin N synthase-like dioxygenase
MHCRRSLKTDRICLRPPAGTVCSHIYIFSDLARYGEKGTILAGFHYDLNFLTIHGKSRFPGLLIWTRNGEKMAVSVPDGCLLVQAGKQFELLTGTLSLLFVSDN